MSCKGRGTKLVTQKTQTHMLEYFKNMKIFPFFGSILKYKRNKKGRENKREHENCHNLLLFTLIFPFLFSFIIFFTYFFFFSTKHNNMLRLSLVLVPFNQFARYVKKLTRVKIKRENSSKCTLILEKDYTFSQEKGLYFYIGYSTGIYI